MIQVSAVRYVKINKAHELTGYSEDAIRTKITTGVWAEGLVWKWGPDGVQLIDLEGYDTWAKMTGKASPRGRHRSASTSGTTENDTLRPSKFPQLQRT